MGASKKHKITIVFGEGAVRRYAEGCTNKRTLRSHGDVRTFSFHTEAELQAFEQGIDEMNGWHDACRYHEDTKEG